MAFFRSHLQNSLRANLWAVLSVFFRLMAAVLEKAIPGETATSSKVAPNAAMGNKEVNHLTEAVNIGFNAVELLSMESVRDPKFSS